MRVTTRPAGRRVRALAARALLLAVALIGAGTGSVRAQDVASDPLRVYLATYGPGSEVWEKFGHNAIWIQDARTGRALSYNWGMFSFSQADFIPRLIRGSMLYWMEARDAQQEADTYAYYNRSVTIQELALTAAQKQELQRFVEWNAREENRYYNYHYYRDNCSTRVRDALDRVLGGALAAQLDTIASGETFRSHSLRLTAGSPLVYTGIELGLADSVDHAITAWEEAFVPMELMRRVRDVRVPDGQDGLRPLVLHEQELFRGAEEPRELPNRVPAYLLIGLIIGGAFALLGRAAGRIPVGGDAVRTGNGRRGAPAARWALAVLSGAWGLAVGFFGTLVLLLWTATGHTFTYGNENLFHTNPLALLLLVLGPAAALGGRWGARPARFVALGLAALALLGLVLKVFPGFDQVNGDLLALMIPAHLGVALAFVYRGEDRAPSP